MTYEALLPWIIGPFGGLILLLFGFFSVVTRRFASPWL